MLRASSICLWLGAFAFESAAFSQTYASIVVGAGSTPAKATVPTSINDQGMIAGYYEDQLFDKQHGLVFDSTPCMPTLLFSPWKDPEIQPCSLRGLRMRMPLSLVEMICAAAEPK